MAQSQAQAQTSKSQWTPLNYLVTPPEDRMDSFSQADDDDDHIRHEAVKETLAPIQEGTPPTSPATSTLPSISSVSEGITQDRPLFPAPTYSKHGLSQIPLFESDERTKPSPVEPRITPFPWCLNITTADDARAYWEDRMEEIRKLKQFRLPAWPPRPSETANERDNESHRQLSSLARASGGVVKRTAPKPTSRATPRPKASVAASPTKHSPPKRRTPKMKTYPEFMETAFSSAQQAAKHKRAPPSKKIDNEKLHWTELEDYSPPTDDLNTNSKQLKVSWPSSALSLADDPDLEHMHPQEVAVASTLRLHGGVYLYNKRKIFQARLQAFKDGKNFTKTAAQSACHIDVNKASQLWEAYDRVGWFNRGWFEQWL